MLQTCCCGLVRDLASASKAIGVFYGVASVLAALVSFTLANVIAGAVGVAVSVLLVVAVERKMTKVQIFVIYLGLE